MAIFDEILQKVSAEDQAVLARYPDLKASMEKLENDLGTVSRFAGEWVNWQKEHWDDEAGMTKAEKYWRDQATAAQAKLESAARPGSGATADEIAQLRKDFDAKLKAVSDESQNTMAGRDAFYRFFITKLGPHQQEFGETPDPQKLLEFMGTNRIIDPNLAYEQMVAGRRKEIADQKQKELLEKHQLELDQARKDEREKTLREAAMGPRGTMPTDQQGGIAGVTARIDQPAKISDEEKNLVAGAKLGDGSLAQLGYAKYVRGELPTQ